jgi:hypothetical protein
MKQLRYAPTFVLVVSLLASALAGSALADDSARIVRLGY